jgi:hypothetical protein
MDACVEGFGIGESHVGEVIGLEVNARQARCH